MRIGLGVGDAAGGATDIDDLIGQVRAAAEHGLSGAWTSQVFGWDALTALAVAGHAVPGISLGTAVVPTYPRHPIALASQALTVQAATGNRLTLGIGPSHQLVIEQMYGYSFDRPIRHMREYLLALGPLLRGEQVSYKGETIAAASTVAIPHATAPSLLVAALGPAMLALTAQLADGTVTWMTGPTTIADHTVPTITAAAAAAGRPDPRVVVGLPVCVTADESGARGRAAEQFAIYGHLPSYRAMLDREGAAGPEDVAVIGDEAAVARVVQRLADGGATELLAAPFGSTEEQARTISVLGEMAAAGRSGAGASIALDG